MTVPMFIQALIKSFPLGIVVILLVLFGLYEAVETKWERRGEDARQKTGQVNK